MTRPACSECGNEHALLFSHINGVFVNVCRACVWQNHRSEATFVTIDGTHWPDGVIWKAA